MTAELVDRLLNEQHPDLAGPDLVEIDRGWDNTMFRLGTRYAVRVPHRAVAAPLIELEQRWLPALQPVLPVAVPAPVRVGEPSPAFAWPWSIVPWFEGRQYASGPPTDERGEAERLGAFLRALHQPAPPDAPRNRWRGVPLTDRRENFDECIAELTTTDEADLLRACFRDGEQASMPAGWDAGERAWCHGDLHLRNVIVDDDRITAVVDWSDLCGGDPAVDLSVAWSFAAPHGATALLDAAGADEQTRRRARGWAANFAAIYLTHSDDDDAQRAVGHRILEGLAASPI